MKIYLAGKISKNDWRHGVVDGLRSNVETNPWILHTLEGSIFKTHDCTGPFFESCDHGCGHGENLHGVAYCHEAQRLSDDRRKETVINCEQAIQISDLFFVWFDFDDEQTAYGTLAEIGIARGLNKKIYIGYAKYCTDVWFAYRLATWREQQNNPIDALKRACSLYLDSKRAVAILERAGKKNTF